MKYARRANIIVALFTLTLIFVFGVLYNVSVRKGVSNAFLADREALTADSLQIIEQLQRTKSTDSWQRIVDKYEDLFIAIKDSDSNMVVRSTARSWSLLDIRVRTPFDYQGRAYMISASMRLMGSRSAQTQYLARLLFIELLIVLSAVILLIFVVYSVILRPYHKFYLLMEDYEHGKPLKPLKLRGNIGRIYARFLKLTQSLDRQQDNQRRIIASISHDIKTPLTSILGYAERLRKTSLPPERQQQYLATIYSKATDIETLIDEFDEYLSYKMEKESFAESFTTEALCQLLRDEFEDELHYAGIAFTLRNRAPGAGMQLNRARTKRVAGNLISNSAKHVPQPGGRIAIDMDADREHVIIRVADNGDGMPEDQLPYIFEPLFTTDDSRKVAGLGLAICKEIVERSGGTIEAGPSEAYGGLEITIIMPRTDRTAKDHT